MTEAGQVHGRAEIRAELLAEKATLAVLKAEAAEIQLQKAKKLAEEADYLAQEAKAQADCVKAVTIATLGPDRARAALTQAAEAQTLTAQALIAAVERRIGSALTAKDRERIASTGPDSLRDWLNNIVLRDSLDSLDSLLAHLEIPVANRRGGI